MSVNDTILDEITGHSVDLQRLEASVKKDIRKELKKLEKTLVADIQNSGMVDAVREQTKVKRMKALLKQTRETIKTTYKQVAKEHAKTLANVASIAEKQAVSALNKSINFKVASVGMSTQMLKAIAGNTLFEGAQSAEWWSRRSEAFHLRFSDTVRQGMMRGDSTSVITKNLIGTSPNKFKDGALQANRRSAEALVRTSIQAVANESRLMTYADNDDIIKSIEWVSTLDSRTSNTCKGLDGLTWSNPDKTPINHGINFPGVTAHWGCRSTQVPIVKSWEELGAKGDFNELPESTRASMDGQVSDKLGYEGWLKGKSEVFQKEALGAKKFDLWKKGNMKFTDLVNQSGNPLTVEQLVVKLDKPTKIVKAVVPNPKFGAEKELDEFVADITDEAKKVINILPKPKGFKEGAGLYHTLEHIVQSPRSRGFEANREVFLHEYGHYIDNILEVGEDGANKYFITHFASKKRLFDSSATDAKELGIGLRMRGQNEKLVDLRIKLTDFVQKTARGEQRKLKHHAYGNISDIIDSMSRGKFYNRHHMPGHGVSYYKSVESQMTENFANLFMLWADKTHWKFTKSMFPTLTKEFELIMAEVLETGKIAKVVDKVEEVAKRSYKDVAPLSKKTMKAVEQAKQNVDDVIAKARRDFTKDYKIYHGGNTEFVAKLRKDPNDFKTLSGSQKEAGTGGNRLGLSTSTNREMASDFAMSQGGDVVTLYIYPDARILNYKGRGGEFLDDLSEKELKKLAKDYDVVRDVNNIGGENELRILNPEVLGTKKQVESYFNIYKEDALRREIVGEVADKVVKKVVKIVDKTPADLGLLDRTKLKKLKAKETDEGLTLLEKETVKRLEKKRADIIKKAKEELG